MKILVIDDNKDIARMLSEYLELMGYETTVANEGRNGLALIEQNKFDAVILDIAMPEFSGFNVIEKLQKDGKLLGNRIFVLTALPLEQFEVDDLKQKGVQAVMKKPVDLDVLLKTIKGTDEAFDVRLA